MYFVGGWWILQTSPHRFYRGSSNLPNNARIFRVLYDEEQQSGFIFIRWDKKEKENYVANKMIDPGVYYNLMLQKK